MKTKLGRITNPKVCLFYDNEGVPCLALEFNTNLTDENGFNGEANIQIHKIKLDNINIDSETKSRRVSMYLPPIIESLNTTIKFDLDFNDEDKAYTIKINENKKKMSLSEIEKELGYKIDLQMD